VTAPTLSFAGDNFGKPYSAARPLHINTYRRTYAYQRRIFPTGTTEGSRYRTLEHASK